MVKLAPLGKSPLSPTFIYSVDPTPYIYNTMFFSESHCEIHDSFDLYDGRKPVGGKVSY
jgi:hypothetical protein